MFNALERLNMQVRIVETAGIPANYQQRPGNMHYRAEVVDMQGTVLTGCEVKSPKTAKAARKFAESLCIEQGWEVVV